MEQKSEREQQQDAERILILVMAVFVFIIFIIGSVFVMIGDAERETKHIQEKHVGGKP